jgi:hypothetical protein|nr:hypothetical protein [Neorhizobium tomejilense]
MFKTPSEITEIFDALLIRELLGSESDRRFELLSHRLERLVGDLNAALGKNALSLKWEAAANGIFEGVDVSGLRDGWKLIGAAFPDRSVKGPDPMVDAIAVGTKINQGHLALIRMSWKVEKYGYSEHWSPAWRGGSPDLSDMTIFDGEEIVAGDLRHALLERLAAATAAACLV